MRAVVPEALLAERRSRGLDRRDELWHGTLHLVPPPGDAQQGLSTELVMLLGPLAERRGLVPRVETGLFRAGDDYRVPDQLYRLPDNGPPAARRAPSSTSKSVAAGQDPREAPQDHEVGVREVLVIDPETRTASLYRAGRVVKPVHSEVQGIAFSTDDGQLQVSWRAGKPRSEPFMVGRPRVQRGMARGRCSRNSRRTPASNWRATGVRSAADAPASSFL